MVLFLLQQQSPICSDQPRPRRSLSPALGIQLIPLCGKDRSDMNLRVVGAGLPRTGTNSLRVALEALLGGPCYHMREIPGHPFDLGQQWDRALAGDVPDWERIYSGYIAAVDWPTSLFWRELSEANPDALVLLSVRESAEVWQQSVGATILPIARSALSPDWQEGTGLVTLFERFAGSRKWDDAALLAEAYERHNAMVREATPPQRLLEWHVGDGWEPICGALGLPVPEQPFPWTNRRAEWG
jgi:hypothetical protein